MCGSTRCSWNRTAVPPGPAAAPVTCGQPQSQRRRSPLVPSEGWRAEALSPRGCTVSQCYSIFLGSKRRNPKSLHVKFTGEGRLKGKYSQEDLSGPAGLVRNRVAAMLGRNREETSRMPSSELCVQPAVMLLSPYMHRHPRPFLPITPAAPRRSLSSRAGSPLSNPLS